VLPWARYLLACTMQGSKLTFLQYCPPPLPSVVGPHVGFTNSFLTSFLLLFAISTHPWASVHHTGKTTLMDTIDDRVQQLEGLARSLCTTLKEEKEALLHSQQQFELVCLHYML